MSVYASLSNLLSFMSATINIQTASEHSYPIFFGNNDLGRFGSDLAKRLPAQKTFALVDENVNAHHFADLKRFLDGAYAQVEWYVVPAGETSKSLFQLGSILDFMLESGLKRVNPVVVIGGGVTGDLGGFAAAVALRGVPFVQVPTTLLAMVDSSVGGKTGINHHTGKNLIGSFCQPEAVYIDLNFLSTLPRREWISGLGEVIKYAAIQRPGLFAETMDLLDRAVAPHDPQWLPVIRSCVDIKADIVRQDEKETGIRSWLNFGHTFAHAMEAASNYNGILHGEAVYLGMVAAAHLSNMLGSSINAATLIGFNRHLNIKWPDSCRDVEQLTLLMSNDKKNTEMGQAFVILDDWGSPRKVVIHDRAMIHQAWQMAMHDLS